MAKPLAGAGVPLGLAVGLPAAVGTGAWPAGMHNTCPGVSSLASESLLALASASTSTPYWSAISVSHSPDCTECSAEQPAGSASPVGLPIGVRDGSAVASSGVELAMVSSVAVSAGPAGVSLGVAGSGVSLGSGVGVPPNCAARAKAVAVA